MGSKLVVSFANPAKHYDTHAIRSPNSMNSAIVGGTNGKSGLRSNGGLASGLLAGRTGMNGNKPGFGGRLSPSQMPFGNGRGWPRCTGALCAFCLLMLLAMKSCVHQVLTACAHVLQQAPLAVLASWVLVAWASTMMTWLCVCNSRPCKCSKWVTIVSVPNSIPLSNLPVSNGECLLPEVMLIL